MFLGVDFEFAKIVKGGRRAKLDSELLSLPATPGKDRLQAALPFIEAFGISSPCRTSRQRTPHIRLDRRPFGLVRTASYLKYKDSKSPGQCQIYLRWIGDYFVRGGFPGEAAGRMGVPTGCGRSVCRSGIVSGNDTGYSFSGDNVSFARDYVWNARNDKLKRRYFYPINSFNQIILPMTSNFTAFLRPFRAACLFVLLTVCCGGCSDSGSVDETPPADQLALSPSSLVFDEQDPAKTSSRSLRPTD